MSDVQARRWESASCGGVYAKFAMNPRHNNLDPLPKRLVAFAVMVVIAVASIWLIDRRAMQHQREMRQQHKTKTIVPGTPQASP